MKVAIVHAEVLPVPPILGGAIGQILYESVEAMTDIDWTVISRWDPVLAKMDFDHRFRHVDIEARFRKAKNLDIELLAPDEMRRFCYVDGATELVCQADPDIVQVENRPTFVPYLKKRLPRAKFVIFIYNRADFSDRRVAQAFAICDSVVFASHNLANQYLGQYSQYKNKFEVIYNAPNPNVWRCGLKKHAETVALRRLYNLKRGCTVLFVGRTASEKGLHCLLDAMALVTKKRPDVKLVVVGSPFFGAVAEDVYMQQVKRQATLLGSGVVFTGFVERTLLPFYFAAADITVVPSLFQDPFPTVVLESLACGIPVVGSRRGGIPEMIDHGRNGFLIDDPKDTPELARQILVLLKRSHSRRKISEQIGRRFSQKKRWRQLQSLYRNIA